MFQPVIIPYDALIAEAQEHVAPGVRVDMCRHPSVSFDERSFWLFRDDKQIAAVAHESRSMLPWRATRMERGMPTAQRRFVTIDHALRWACGN